MRTRTLVSWGKLINVIEDDDGNCCPLGERTFWILFTSHRLPHSSLAFSETGPGACSTFWVLLAFSLVAHTKYQRPGELKPVPVCPFLLRISVSFHILSTTLLQMCSWSLFSISDAYFQITSLQFFEMKLWNLVNSGNWTCLTLITFCILFYKELLDEVIHKE